MGYSGAVVTPVIRLNTAIVDKTGDKGTGGRSHDGPPELRQVRRSAKDCGGDGAGRVMVPRNWATTYPVTSFLGKRPAAARSSVTAG